MSVKAHHIATFFLVASIVLATLAVTAAKSPVAFASCGTGDQINITAPTANQALNGNVTLQASTAGSYAQPSAVTFMISAPTATTIGPASLVSGALDTWALPWSTASLSSGSYQLVAIAQYGTNTTLNCPSAALPINVIRPAPSPSPTGPAGSPTPQPGSPHLNLTISPQNWSGVPGSTQLFTIAGQFVQSTTASIPVTPSGGATYSWHTDGGVVTTASLPTATFTAGPKAGAFHVGAVVTMNGIQGSIAATISIAPPQQPASPPPSPSASPTAAYTYTYNGTQYQLSAAQITALTSTASIFRPVQSSNADPQVPIVTLGCIKTALGTDFTNISAGQLAPALTDRLKADQCFSGNNRIPSTLAPVEPSLITQVQTATGQVTLASAHNQTVAGSQGASMNSIVLAGTATPNSNVFVYFFSDPMVLRAQSDGQGKWSYVLENPLKPGHHEIYAVSQKDASTFVRTPAVPITVAAAASDQAGTGLIIDNVLSPAQVTYALGSVVLLLAALLILWRVVWRKRMHVPAGETGPIVQPAVAAIQTDPDVSMPTSPPPEVDGKK